MNDEYEWLATPTRGATLHASVDDAALCDKKKNLSRPRTNHLTRIGANTKHCVTCTQKIENPPTRKSPSYRV